MLHRSALVLLSLAALSACAPAGSGAEGLGVDADGKIYGGDAPDAAHHDAVVSIHRQLSGFTLPQPFCSGTLIADDVILTAAHCMDTGSGAQPVTAREPADLMVFVGDRPVGNLTGNTWAVSEVEIHEDYDRIWLEHDLALLRLTTPVTTVAPVDALPHAEGFTADDVGMTVNFAGFGYTESGSYGAKIQADGTLDGLGCDVVGCTSAGFPDTQISYDQRSGIGTCNGDSGGPAFVERDGVVYTAGITSYGDANCTRYGVSTRVDAYETLIADFVAASSTTVPASCGDSVCDQGESCDGRGPTDVCASDCDGLMTGPFMDRFCDVGPLCVGPGCT